MNSTIIGLTYDSFEILSISLQDTILLLGAESDCRLYIALVY